MIKIFSLFTTFIICLSTFGQNIKLTQTKTKDDIKILNGDYHLFFKRTDIISTINQVDKVLGLNNSVVIESIKTKKINVIQLNSKDLKDKNFIDIFKSNIGVYLLLKGKVTIYKAKKQVINIFADEAPQMVDFNGNSTRRIFFSEENSENEIFLGDMNTKVEEDK